LLTAVLVAAWVGSFELAAVAANAGLHSAAVVSAKTETPAQKRLPRIVILPMSFPITIRPSGPPNLFLTRNVRLIGANLRHFPEKARGRSGKFISMLNPIARNICRRYVPSANAKIASNIALRGCPYAEVVQSFAQPQTEKDSPL
jgi:hypothetical protein